MGIVIPGRVAVPAEYHSAYRATVVGVGSFIEWVVGWCVDETYRQGIAPCLYAVYIRFKKLLVIHPVNEYTQPCP